MKGNLNFKTLDFDGHTPILRFIPLPPKISVETSRFSLFMSVDPHSYSGNLDTATD